MIQKVMKKIIYNEDDTNENNEFSDEINDKSENNNFNSDFNDDDNLKKIKNKLNDMAKEYYKNNSNNSFNDFNENLIPNKRKNSGFINNHLKNINDILNKDLDNLKEDKKNKKRKKFIHNMKLFD